MRLIKVGVQVVVWVTVVFNEDGFDEQRWFVLPFVVHQSDDAYALDPKPELSGGLRLVIFLDFQGHGGNVKVSFKGVKQVGVGYARRIWVGGGLVDELVN